VAALKEIDQTQKKNEEKKPNNHVIIFLFFSLCTLPYSRNDVFCVGFFFSKKKRLGGGKNRSQAFIQNFSQTGTDF
jgi:hypothetical protein